MAENKLDLSNLFNTEPPTTDIHKSNWDYIVSFTIIVRDKEEYPEESERAEIITRSFMPIRCDLNSVCYWGECVDNAEVTSILPTLVTGRYAYEDNDFPEPGVYNYVLAVVTKGDKYWTDCGYEYDAWEEYELLSRYKYTDKEVPYVIREVAADDTLDERFMPGGEFEPLMQLDDD